MSEICLCFKFIPYFFFFLKQTFPRGAYHPPGGRGMPVPMRGMVPPPFNVGGMQDDDEDDYPKGCLPISFEAFAYLLEKSTPEDQKLVWIHTRIHIHTCIIYIAKYSLVLF